MTISRVKSILIVLLASLTVYQTGVLWFVNITGGNFLMNYIPFMHQEVIPEGVSRLVKPKRIITVHVDGSFSVRYSGLEELAAKRYGDMILSQLLQSGNFIEAVSLNLDASNLGASNLGASDLDALDLSDGNEAFSYFLSGPAYIFEYAFPMEPEWFAAGYAERGSVLSARVNTPFRQVIIRPNDWAPIGGQIYPIVYFIGENGYAYGFYTSLAYDEYFQESFFNDAIVGASDTGPSYIFQPDAEFSGAFSFARDPDSIFFGVSVTNPYADAHGGFSLNFIQDQVAVFFSNAGAIRPIVGSDVWVYRDVNTVVRYYDTHVLEYISYRAIDRSGTPSFVVDFAAAVQFIERDHLVINEFYLADFRENNGQHVFYFGYVLGDASLNLPNFPIVVTVDHGTVVRYTKTAFNFHTDEHVRLTGREFDRLVRFILP